jgi:hypothetical protein
MRRGGALLATPGGPASGSLQRVEIEVEDEGRFGCGYAALGAMQAIARHFCGLGGMPEA